MRRKIYLAILVVVIALGLMQLFRPEKIPNSEAKDLAGVPKEVNDILRRSCYDCHSSETNLRWYDKITPANFIIESHVRAGRAAFSFSNFDSLNTAQQNSALYYALNKALCNEMPLPAYSLVHPETKLTTEDIQTLKGYLSNRTPRKLFDSTQTAAVEAAYNNRLNTSINKEVSPTPNGISYKQDWRNWTAISTSDRFDNGSMRIIYGNDIAVKAIQQKKINPFPDGAILAKAAFQQLPGKDGIIRTGQFIQVEFMIKDAQKYAATNGWGWARWKGGDLKPYGTDAGFTNECTSCHHPVKNNDYVFTAPLDLYSFVHSANTPAENPLLEKVLMSSVDPKDNSMSTLYANTIAWDYATKHNDTKYPSGAVLYQVTWKQKPDSLWFGANIPKEIQSIERISYTSNSPNYELYKGHSMQKATSIPDTTRIPGIAAQKMAVSP